MIFKTLSLLLFAAPLSSQVITEVIHLERIHYQVVTKTATYLYDPVAGGFSSIIDPAGKDWIAYQDQPWGEYPASAGSSFRGLPNLVFGGEDDGVGHPGHQKCSSKIAGSQIITESKSGKWSWTWTFYPGHARLEVQKTDQTQPYWFLYEGPAGGVYTSKQTVWGTDVKGPNFDRFDQYKGSMNESNYQWMYFSTVAAKASLWIAMATPDELPDHYSLLGNTELGIDSPNGMVSAGFGRVQPRQPLLRGAQTFYIGCYKKAVLDKKRHRAISKSIRKIIK